jgi:hypothetical protein
MAADTTVWLPGGWLDGTGACHHDAAVRPVCGADEEWLYGLPLSTPEASVVTELLARCVSRIGPDPSTAPAADTLRELCAGDREWLMLRLWQLTFGDRVEFTLTCPEPSCGARIDIDFALSGLPADGPPQQPEYQLTVRDGDTELRLRFRLPRGSDLEAMGRSPDEHGQDRAGALLGRCVLGAEPPPADGARPTVLLARSSRLRAALAERMREYSALVQREFDVPCPECERPFSMPFDPILEFLAEMLRRRSEFEHDVHLLSLRYHWPLSEILALPRPRRRRYVRLMHAYSEPEPAVAGW